MPIIGRPNDDKTLTENEQNSVLFLLHMNGTEKCVRKFDLNVMNHTRHGRQVARPGVKTLCKLTAKRFPAKSILTFYSTTAIGGSLKGYLLDERGTEGGFARRERERDRENKDLRNPPVR